MVQPELTIAQGTLRGSTGRNLKGQTFYKFQGIPYAKPPLGELRFKAPVPPEKWSGIFYATKEGDPSLHRDIQKNGEPVGSENCLVLNVFTKTLPEFDEELRPVLFWIHGGGFTYHSSSEEFYGPEFLLTEAVVLVTINYRLGLLGFASFEDPSLDVPGNAGLKDQVQALKWVQKNISKFGGDPNNVTIFGESAGGAAVHLLMLSPMGRGLFHKAIAQSGCALNPWVRGTRGSKLIAKALGLEGADDKTIYDALVKKSVDEIIKIQDQFVDDLLPDHIRPVSFIVEQGSKEPFLDKEPMEVMLSGTYNHVPLTIGYTSSEGMVFDIYKIPNAPDNLNFENMVPWFLGYKEDSGEKQAVAQKLQKFYFGDEEYSSRTWQNKIDLVSDVQFLYGIHVTILTHLKTSKAPIYLYKMTLETQLNNFKALAKTDLPGVCHGDDVCYLFKQALTLDVQPGSLEEISLTKFLKLWTNFAKFGNPTPHKDDQLLKAIWKPVTGSDLDFLDIGVELVARNSPDSERMRFWKTLFAESPSGLKAGRANF